MALFKPRERLDIDPFTDLLFNALLTFTFLFLIALLLMNPTAKTGIINPKAEFMITVSWPDHSPDDIWFKRPQEGLMHLDRDDRGRVNDMQLIDGKEIVNPLNQEIVSIRGRPAGEFIVNIHYYRSQTLQAIPVTVYLAEVNPTLKVLHYATTTLQREGEERTAVRFSITPQGQVTAINTLQKSLVLGGKI